MGKYLNSRVPFEVYKEIAGTRFFVDKSLLLEDVLRGMEMDGQKYLCITRPRRFGKSVMANMVAAFFGKAVDAQGLFEPLAIAGKENYKAHLNKHNIVYIDFSEVPRDCGNYRQYIARIQEGINNDLARAYDDLSINIAKASWDIMTDIFQEKGEKFVFVMDEWDAVFHMSFITQDDKKDYLLFLKSLLKGKVYVELAYMTGVLPIARNHASHGTQESVDSFVDVSGESLQAVFPADTPYSGGSELNMFLEYDMATKKRFSEYFGFLDSEVDKLFEIYEKGTAEPAITREELRIWYDGYCTAMGKRIYNPRSVVCALMDNELSNYWTSSGPYDEIFYYIRNNIQDVRDDIVLMVSGEPVSIALQGYAVTGTELKTKNQIYSAMVVYGLLTYENKMVSIPNKELMDKFNELLLNNDSLGYVYNLARESERMLAATLARDTDTMAGILEFAHDTESPIFSYNSEIELAAVINLVYLAARDRYRVEREDKAGKGYVDFIFYPEVKSADAIILELKVGSTHKKAIQQIKDKNYVSRLRGKLGEKPKYTGKILAVGISYNKKTKKHMCKVELL